MAGGKIAAKVGRAACPHAAEDGGLAAKTSLTGLTRFTGFKEGADDHVNPLKTKPSGVAWLGDIPKGWEVDKVKRFFRQTNTRGNVTPTLLAATQKYGMYPQDRLEGVVKVKEETDLQLFKTVHIDDFVISLRSFQGGFAHSSYEGVCSPAYQTFHATKVIWPRFYSYLFKCGSFIQMINSLTVGIREGKNINYSDFAECLMIYPPLPEQRAIADYLDEKCGVIDAAIAEAKKGIEEYKAWKKSLIFEAVTGKRRVGVFNAESQRRRGRREAEKMKSSGIPWIGAIPEGWRVMKLRHCFRLIGSGTTPNSNDSTYFGGDIAWLQSGDLNGGILKTTTKTITDIALNDYPALKIYKSPFLAIAMYGASIANFSLVQIDACTNQACCALTSNIEGVDLRFAVYSIVVAKDGLILAARGGTQPNISQEIIKGFRISLPPLPEQQAIADYLDEKCAAIDAMVAEKEALIAELETYKKSLIYEVVTGKREVA